MPYSLSHPSPESYYHLIAQFTDEVLLESERRVGTVVDDFQDFLHRLGMEEPRAREEYLLELLSFGILWQTYAASAMAVRWAPWLLLSQMAVWRKTHRRWKPTIDRLRGWAMTALLLPNTEERPVVAPSLDAVDRVCLWFEATGEFREEALRFVRWRGYWGTLDEESRTHVFLSIGEMARWFAPRAKEVLGAHTAGVDSFRSRSRHRYRWREDRISCMRPAEEYHLNMVGAEVMNRAFRGDFRVADETALLLPGCMRKDATQCRARRYPEGLLCLGCDPTCPVHTLREKGKKEGFSVYVIPHASDLSLWAPRPGHPRRRVLASACITTLVEGGWELRRYGVPAQCVPLDFSGCRKHWDPVGRTTQFWEGKLDELLVADPS